MNISKFIAKLVLAFFVFSSVSIQNPIFAAGEQNNIDVKALKYTLPVVGLLLAGGYVLSVALDHADSVSRRTPISITDSAIAVAYAVGGIFTCAASMLGAGLILLSAHDEGCALRAEAEGNAGR